MITNRHACAVAAAIMMCSLGCGGKANSNAPVGPGACNSANASAVADLQARIADKRDAVLALDELSGEDGSAVQAVIDIVTDDLCQYSTGASGDCGVAVEALRGLTASGGIASTREQLSGQLAGLNSTLLALQQGSCP